MAQNKKYAAVKALLEAGGVVHIADIFEYVPKSSTYKLLNVGYLSFLKKLDNPGLFTIEELIILSELIGVHEDVIITLAKNEAKELHKKRKNRG
ncbi:hypothetical protein [Chitinophaga sp. HK235]|uniref:hypothetical protein n=1 Tax=Chitinophaga sp. HK235 TaxID=2952571 RepID=UPI001BA94D2C|nr:hypothetical protein [Chitinophaga sp. HK235]